jgi:hypothetical protein
MSTVSIHNNILCIEWHQFTRILGSGSGVTYSVICSLIFKKGFILLRKCVVILFLLAILVILLVSANNE